MLRELLLLHEQVEVRMHLSQAAMRRMIKKHRQGRRQCRRQAGISLGLHPATRYRTISTWPLPARWSVYNSYNAAPAAEPSRDLPRNHKPPEFLCCARPGDAGTLEHKLPLRQSSLGAPSSSVQNSTHAPQSRVRTCIASDRSRTGAMLHVHR